jgi:hypothetical protein
LGRREGVNLQQEVEPQQTERPPRDSPLKDTTDRYVGGRNEHTSRQGGHNGFSRYLVLPARPAAELCRSLALSSGLRMPNDPTWRSLTIDEALAKIAEPLITRGLATKGRGASKREIAAAEKRLGRPLPVEVRVFYEHVTPVPECTQFGGGSVGFQPIGDADLNWLDDPIVREEKLWVGPQGDCWLDGWSTARLLVIGYTEFGDWLLWSAGLSGLPDGAIVLTDHEGENNPIVLGDSLAQWLGRYWTYGFIEYSIAEGSLDDVGPAKTKTFLSDHLRLNSQCGWAKQRLRRL